MLDVTNQSKETLWVQLFLLIAVSTVRKSQQFVLQFGFSYISSFLCCGDLNFSGAVVWDDDFYGASASLCLLFNVHLAKVIIQSLNTTNACNCCLVWRYILRTMCAHCKLSRCCTTLTVVFGLFVPSTSRYKLTIRKSIFGNCEILNHRTSESPF